MGLPNEVMTGLLGRSSTSSSSYTISRSLRLRASASAYLNRTPGSASNRRTWTWSGWAKRGAFPSAYSTLFNAGTVLSGNTGFFGIRWTANQTLDVTTDSTDLRQTTQVFRDPSAWYHIVVAIDTTQATAANRVKVYINGSEVTSFGTSNNPTQNLDTAVNNNVLHEICRTSWSSDGYFDGYLTEVNFIDGQALTPSSFGETDSTTGVWKPKTYSGSYGTNGFYLNFSDNSAATAAAIGKDSSGNGNNWTPNNISVTSGATYDSMTDVPTAYDDSTEYGRGNYATFNPIQLSPTAVLSEGNLRIDPTGTGVGAIAKSTFGGSGSIKFYTEFTIGNVGTGSSWVHCAIADSSANPMLATFNGSFSYYRKDGNINGSSYASYTTGDIIAAAVDTGAGTISWYKNNSLQVTLSGAAYDAYFPMLMVSNAGSSYGYLNCGQRPFTYTPPSGYKALNTQNLSTPTIVKGNGYMDATTYTGTGSSQSIANGGSMQPDLVWIKNRNSTENNILFDSVRGADIYLYSNLTNAEGGPGGALTAFNSNGFTLSTSAAVNFNTYTYVGWQWKKGATPGFDIVTYTGTGSARTISHSLGVTPSFMVVKDRSQSKNWTAYHSSIGNTQYLQLSSTAAATTDSTVWNNTSPTSSVFSLGTKTEVNGSGDNYVAYLWAEVAGFSKFGSYTGNGSADGPFVYCGFRPRYVLIKNITAASTDYWYVTDSARDSYNVVNRYLSPSQSAAEGTSAQLQDFLANGFKIRDTGTQQNTNGSTYIYAAFAENPFKYALAR